MKSPAAKRVQNTEVHVDRSARPGWLTGADRMPVLGEEVFCAVGAGEVAALLGKTGDGSRLLEIRLPTAGAKPFFAAASNVLVAPAAAAKRAKPEALSG